MKVSIICISADPKVWYYKEAIAVRVMEYGLSNSLLRLARFDSSAHSPYT